MPTNDFFAYSFHNPPDLMFTNQIMIRLMATCLIVIRPIIFSLKTTSSVEFGRAASRGGLARRPLLRLAPKKVSLPYYAKVHKNCDPFRNREFLDYLVDYLLFRF